METKITHDALDHTLTYHAAQQNNESDVLSFTLPRYRGSLDLGALSPSLFLMREDGSTDVIQATEDHILVLETGTDTVTILWTLTEWATEQAGALYYQLVFRSDEEKPKRYATFPAKLTITRSIDAEETLVASYPTFFWQWDREMKKIRADLDKQSDTLQYALLSANKLTLPADLPLHSLPDQLKTPGSYYGTADNWSLSGTVRVNGPYLLTVEQTEAPEADAHTLVQTVFFYTQGRIFTRYLEETDAGKWSSFIEVTYQPPTIRVLQAKAERGFLFNLYTTGLIVPAGRTCMETEVQDFIGPITIGDTGDVSFTPGNESISMTVTKPPNCDPHITNGIFVEWSGTNRTSYYPSARVRLGRPTSDDGALGMDVFSSRRTPLTCGVMLYACTASLGTQVKQYGSAQVTIPNDSTIHHIRIPFYQFGINDPSIMTDGTSICCRISWSDQTDSVNSGDVVWISDVGYFDDRI